MELKINPSLDSIDWERISALFDEVNWDNRSPTDIKNSFNKSSHYCFVYLSNTIVGFGRTVDDDKYYALIVDVVVDPAQQGKGIGKTIIETLKNRLKGYNFITLTAAPGKSGFYEKIGWKKQSSAFIYPKDEEQAAEHSIR